MNRVVGLETEYGCLTADPMGPPSIVGRVRNWIFERQRFGLADLHQRDWDEPAGNGGFLFNGGRAYVDMGHLEYCTPECMGLCDLLRFDRAGDALLLQAVAGLGQSNQVQFIRNNIDHYSGATFGCHENYLVRRAAPLTESNVLALLAFLTLRVLYAGAGRVGATVGAELRGDLARSGADGYFQLSQRADYINNDLFEWVQFNRAIINTRDEPLADVRRYRRLHLLHGDTSVLPTTLALKVGTTSLVLDLLEMDCLPRVVLADAVLAFRHLSHHPDGPWEVTLANDRPAHAVELLAQFQARAARELAGRDPETDFLIAQWDRTLRALVTQPEDLVGQVDWITKRWILAAFCQKEHLSWSDPWVKSLDLEYHQIDPERSLGLALDHTPPEWALHPPALAEAMRLPPADTRACVRTRVMERLRDLPIRYFVDWEVIDAEGVTSLNLSDPFDTDPTSAEAWAHHVRTLALQLAAPPSA